MLRIFPLSQSWQVVVNEDEEVDGLSKLVMPEGANSEPLHFPYVLVTRSFCSTLDVAIFRLSAVLTLAQVDTEARKMIGDVSITEFSQRLTRLAAGQANRVYVGELPPQTKSFKADGDEGPSRKRLRGQVKLAPRKRRAPASTDSDADDKDTVIDHDDEEEGEDVGETEVVAKKATDEAAGNRVETPSYTPTPSPEHVGTGVESNCSPLCQMDMEGVKALVAIAAAKVTKGGSIKKAPKKKGLFDVARIFSDDESSDETPTSPVGRSLGLSTALGAMVDAGGAGGECGRWDFGLC